jgi:hypothetical protein
LDLHLLEFWCTLKSWGVVTGFLERGISGDDPVLFCSKFPLNSSLKIEV